MVLLRASLMAIAMMLVSVQVSATDGWTSFKARFMTSEGRILNISATPKGRGTACCWRSGTTTAAAAEKSSERPVLHRKYNPAAADAVADKNNASDGDVLIAWALLKAGQKWQNTAYLQTSDRIQRAIANTR
ncbi:glycosyl hydrolase family 8 [Erwinia tracheiphila]|uniref:glycosyl hydrolase family 8 n=1 Tax=Erwinia tracheiphila TaxID=65700 RepID=UPI0026989A44